MAFPTDDGKFILDTDTLDITIGTVLTQIQTRVEKVLSYGSLTLDKGIIV